MTGTRFCRRIALRIGAIELTDVNPTIVLPTDSTEPERQAVPVAAMALSVLRDPADSMLGD